jgi:CubicO group peptidase (beta-lactamase class C family)
MRRRSASRLAVPLFAALAACTPVAAAPPTHPATIQAPPRDAVAWPGATWEHVASPESIGWSSAKLKAAEDYSHTIATEAVFVVVGGRVLAGWGQTTKKLKLHSIRKSLLSALFGIEVAEKHIDLSSTLGSLAIDDNEPSLDAEEKKATVRDLLEARSGVYHPALCAPTQMTESRPARHSHAPGTFWYYNNWDFNALGTIFERASKDSVYRAFKIRIADPIGMQDYEVADSNYGTGPESVHPCYMFRMTARDLARFGLLYLRHGEWKGKQVVPRAWVDESLRPASDIGTYGAGGGYGYLWWLTIDGKHLPGMTVPEGSFSARGVGGHYMLVVPAYDLVIVHRVDTDIEGREVTKPQIAKLVQMIFDARSAG